MNPNPANNQITDNNNQPINPASTQNPVEAVQTPPQNPIEPNPVTNTKLPQLENETPMDITIYPSNENPEVSIEPEKINESESKIQPQAVSSISPAPELPPLPPLPPLPSNTAAQTPITPVQEVKVAETTPKVEETIPNLTQPTPITTNPVANQENKLTNPNTQKIAIIGGVLIGILLVAGISVYYLTGLTNKNNSKNVAIPVSPKPTPTPMPTPTPIAQNVTVAEYKLKVDSISNKYATLIKNNPVNLNSNVLNTDTVKFISDELFALATEVNEFNVPTELSNINSNLYQELNSQVQVYDTLLKSYKTANSLNPNIKNKFLTDSKTSLDRLNLLLNEIKNLK